MEEKRRACLVKSGFAAEDWTKERRATEKIILLCAVLLAERMRLVFCDSVMSRISLNPWRFMNLPLRVGSKELTGMDGSSNFQFVSKNLSHLSEMQRRLSDSSYTGITL